MDNTAKVEKIKKILDKFTLEEIDEVFHFMKKYSLERFAAEVLKIERNEEALKKKIEEITTGGKQS